MPAHSEKSPSARCPAGHERPPHRGRSCPGCRRDRVVDLAAAADTTMPRSSLAAAVDAVAAGGQALGHLERALAAGPLALQLGAPPIAGRLTIELIACGSTVLTVPRCARCGRTGKPLTRGEGGGVCQRCRAWQQASACSSCGRLKPVAARDGAGGPLCELCRRHCGRADRTCGRCGKTAPIAVRARDGAPDICVNCYRMPDAVCSVCGKRRNATSPIPTDRSAHPVHRNPPRSAPAAARNAHRRRAGRKDRSATRATPPRCSTADLAHAAVHGEGWLPRAVCTRIPAPTVLGCRSPTPAPTAGSKTSSTNEADAPDVVCGGAPRHCSPGPTARSRPGWRRCSRRSARHATRDRR